MAAICGLFWQASHFSKNYRSLYLASFGIILGYFSAYHMVTLSWTLRLGWSDYLYIIHRESDVFLCRRCISHARNLSRMDEKFKENGKNASFKFVPIVLLEKKHVLGSSHVWPDWAIFQSSCQANFLTIVAQIFVFFGLIWKPSIFK